ncbi:LOW QUALITY PROTEIN: death domain-containing protein CRADD [Mustelus asterias]
MDEKHRRILRRLRLELSSQLRVDMVVEYLYQERVLSQAFLEEIRAEPVSIRRSLKLLDHLPSRGARGFPAFADSLREEFPWLCRRLEEEEMSLELITISFPDELRLAISDHILKSVPTDKQLNQLSSHLGPDWERIVVDLGLKVPDLYRCKMNHQYNLQAQILAALILWKRRLGKQATVRSLCDSLILAETDPGMIIKIFQENL